MLLNLLLPYGAERLNRRLISDSKGQSALFDAIMFLVIMIIASSIISVFADQFSKNAALSQRDELMDYARDTSESVFGATLNSTGYEDEDGNIITRPPGDTKVMNLILEELYLIRAGLPSENFALGYEKDIKICIENLVTSSYHFAITGKYTRYNLDTDIEVFISDIVPNYSSTEEVKSDNIDYSQLVPKNNLASIVNSQPMIGGEGEAELSFLLWR
jgi:hypothetical protein